MTVKENIMLGGHSQVPGNMLQNLASTLTIRRSEGALGHLRHTLLIITVYVFPGGHLGGSEI